MPSVTHAHCYGDKVSAHTLSKQGYNNQLLRIKRVRVLGVAFAYHTGNRCCRPGTGVTGDLLQEIGVGAGHRRTER